MATVIPILMKDTITQMKSSVSHGGKCKYIISKHNKVKLLETKLRGNSECREILLWRGEFNFFK